MLMGNKKKKREAIKKSRGPFENSYEYKFAIDAGYQISF